MSLPARPHASASRSHRLRGTAARIDSRFRAREAIGTQPERVIFEMYGAKRDARPGLVHPQCIRHASRLFV